LRIHRAIECGRGVKDIGRGPGDDWGWLNGRTGHDPGGCVHELTIVTKRAAVIGNCARVFIQPPATNEAGGGGVTAIGIAIHPVLDGGLIQRNGPQAHRAEAALIITVASACFREVCAGVNDARAGQSRAHQRAVQK
jgi:hypothetical protein